MARWSTWRRRWSTARDMVLQPTGGPTACSWYAGIFLITIRRWVNPSLLFVTPLKLSSSSNVIHHLYSTSFANLIMCSVHFHHANLNVFIKCLKTALVTFRLWAGSGSLYRAVRPEMEKARRLQYVLRECHGKWCRLQSVACWYLGILCKAGYKVCQCFTVSRLIYCENCVFLVHSLNHRPFRLLTS